jgi:hypothetical protein
MSAFSKSRQHLWPTTFRAKLRYVDARDMAVVAGIRTHYTYAVNNLYDPDLTGIGHQPMGLDQLLGTTSTTGFYEHAYVNNAEITVDFGYAGGSNIPTVVGAILSPESALAPTDYEQLIEAGAAYAIVTLYDSKAKLRFKVNVPKELGLGKNTSPLQCTNAAGPNRELYLHVFVAPQDGGGTDSYPGCDITTTLLLDTVFVAPRIPGQS